MKFTITVTVSNDINPAMLRKILGRPRDAFLLRHRIAFALEKTTNEALHIHDVFRYPVTQIEVEPDEPVISIPEE